MLEDDNFVFHLLETIEGKSFRILADEIPCRPTSPEDVNIYVGRDIALINKDHWIPGTKNIMIVNPDFYFESLLFGNPSSLHGFDAVIFNTRNREQFMSLSGLVDGKAVRLPLDITLTCPFFTEAAIALTLAELAHASQICLVGVNVYEREKYLKKYMRHVRSQEIHIFQKLSSHGKIRIT